MPSTTRETANEASRSQTIEYTVYFIFGALDILLAFRLVLKFLGASTSSAFVRMIYSFSNMFIWPFEGIFRRAVTEGIETASVLEPATIVALIVYGILAWGIVKLIHLFYGEIKE
jgi:hypothetical protein